MSSLQAYPVHLGDAGLSAHGRGARLETEVGMSAEAVIAANGALKLEMEPGTYYWCRTGRSGKQPFCDGAHEGTSFAPVNLEIVERWPVAWCGGKRTGNPPHCYGTHKTL